MKWVLVLVLGVVVAAVVLAVVVATVGALLPREHVASRSLVIHQPVESVWAAISDFQSAPSWRKDVKNVERGPDQNGHPVWIEQGSNGTLPMEVLVAEAPSRLITRIADPGMPFGGTWTYQLAAETGAARLTITEAGWVSNPIFRFVSRFVMGHHATLDAYLRNVAARFHEPATLSGH